MPHPENPYCFGVPLREERLFVGRQDALESVFRDLLSTRFPGKVSLYGARNIGTTSFMMALADPAIQRRCGAAALKDWKFIFLDLKELSVVTPQTLTRLFLNSIDTALGIRVSNRPELYESVKAAADAVDSSGRNLVLMLDEIDRLVEMGPDFEFVDSFFYAILNRAGSNLNMVTASKRPLNELFVSCQSRSGGDVSSPFFVHFRPVRISLFSPEEVKQLVVVVSEGAGLPLAEFERRILRLGGYFPHFLQIACFTVFQALAAKGTLARRDWNSITTGFQAQAEPYYQHFWRNFTDFERQAVVEIAKEHTCSMLPDDFATAAARLPQYFEQVNQVDVAVNTQFRRELQAGARRGDEVSEWLWSIIRKKRGALRLFSASFEQYIISRSREFVASGERDLIPQVMELLYLNLRKHFEKKPPEYEREVQRAIQLILDAGGLQFDREAEQFRFSIKGWRPDHVSPAGIALEAKLCRRSEDAVRIVEEISADILPYRSRFRAVIVVVYDLGYIVDEAKFRGDFESLDGVYVLIRKH
jgi:hypothetical protein